MSLSAKDQGLMNAVGRVLLDEIERAVKPLRERIAELEKRGIEFRGTHQRAQEYKRGSVVNHDDCLWSAVVDVQPNQIPGRDSAWQLILRGPQDRRATTQPRHGVRS